MPLSMLNSGESRSIIKVGGKEKTKKFLESLGFIEGAEISIVSELAGNMIINVKEARVAIDKSLASCIIV